MLVRKSALDQLGPLNEDPTLRASEDYEYWLRLLIRRDRSILFLSAPLVLYRIHASNIFSSNELDGTIASARRELERIRRILRANQDALGQRRVEEAVEHWEHKVRRYSATQSIYRGALSLGGVLRAEGLSIGERLGIVLRGLVKQALTKKSTVPSTGSQRPER